MINHKFNNNFKNYIFLKKKKKKLITLLLIVLLRILNPTNQNFLNINANRRN